MIDASGALEAVSDGDRSEGGSPVALAARQAEVEKLV